MGSMTAEGYKDCVNEGMMTLDTAISIHLSSNHYPPIPSSMIGPAKRAIAKANKGEWDKKIRMPEGVEHRVYGSLVPVHVVMDYMHLHTFMEQHDDYYEEEEDE